MKWRMLPRKTPSRVNNDASASRMLLTKAPNVHIVHAAFLGITVLSSIGRARFPEISVRAVTHCGRGPWVCGSRTAPTCMNVQNALQFWIENARQRGFRVSRCNAFVTSPKVEQVVCPPGVVMKERIARARQGFANRMKMSVHKKAVGSTRQGGTPTGPQSFEQLAKQGSRKGINRQYAMTTKAGYECIAHALQVLRTGSPTITPIDGIGVFDLISRQTMLEGLQRAEVVLWTRSEHLWRAILVKSTSAAALHRPILCSSCSLL